MHFKVQIYLKGLDKYSPWKNNDLWMIIQTSRPIKPEIITISQHRLDYSEEFINIVTSFWKDLNEPPKSKKK